MHKEGYREDEIKQGDKRMSEKNITISILSLTFLVLLIGVSTFSGATIDEYLYLCLWYLIACGLIYVN